MKSTSKDIKKFTALFGREVETCDEPKAINGFRNFTKKFRDFFSTGENFEKEQNLITHRILVSKQLHLDLTILGQILKKLKKTVQKIRTSSGFTKLVRRYVYSPRASKLIGRINNHLHHLGRSLPNYVSYDDFIIKVVQLVPELTLVNNNIFEINYFSSFGFIINKCAVYKDQYYINNTSEQKMWLSGGVSYYLNLPYKNYKVTGLDFWQVPENEYTFKNAQKARAERDAWRARIKLVTKRKNKSYVNKYQFNSEDFPLILKDEPLLSKNLSNAKAGARLTVRPSYSKILKTTSFHKSDKAQEGTSTPPPAKPDSPVLRWERILAKSGVCTFCSVRTTDKRIPVRTLRILLSKHTNCVCIQAQQQGDFAPIPDDAEKAAAVLHYFELKTMMEKPGDDEIIAMEARKNEIYVKFPSLATQEKGTKLQSILQTAKNLFTPPSPNSTMHKTLDALQPTNITHIKEVVDQMSKAMDAPIFKKLADGDFLDKLNDQGEVGIGMKKEIKEFGDKAEGFADQMHQMSQRLENTAALGHSLVDKWFGASDRQNRVITIMSRVCGLILSIPIYMELNNRGRMLLFVSQVLLMDLPQEIYRTMQDLYLGIVSKVESSPVLTAAMSDELSDKGSAVQQADEPSPFSELISPMSQLISLGMVATVSGGSDTSIKKITSAGNIARAFTNVRTLGDAVKTSLEVSQKQLFSLITGLPEGIESLEGVAAGLTEWLELIKMTIDNPDWLGVYLQDNRNQEVMTGLIETGEVLLRKLFKSSEGDAIRMQAYIKNALVVLRKFSTAMVSARAGSKDRVLPVSAIFWGPPGIGKTHCINQLVVDLFRFQPPEYRRQFTKLEDIKYTKAETSDYYDGYMNHFAYVQDEVFTSTIKEDLIKDAKRVIELIQESSPPLDMALLENKGKVFFQSKYVLFTTNRPSIVAGLPVIDENAIRRRMHFTVYIHIPPRFKEDGRFSPRLWAVEAERRGIPVNIPSYATFEVIRENGQSYYCSYQELVRNMHRAHMENDRNFTVNHQHQMNVFLEDYALPDDQPDLIMETPPDTEDPYNDNRPQRNNLGNNAWAEMQSDRDDEFYRQGFGQTPISSNGSRTSSSRAAPSSHSSASRTTESSHRSGAGEVFDALTRVRSVVYQTNSTMLSDAKVATGIGKIEKTTDSHKVFMERFKLVSEDQLICFYYFLWSCKTQKHLEAAMGSAFNIVYRVPHGESIEKDGKIDPAIQRAMQKELGLPITSSIRVGWRRFTQKIKDHPWTSLLIGGSVLGVLILGIVALARYCKADKEKVKAVVKEQTVAEGIYPNSGDHKTGKPNVSMNAPRFTKKEGFYTQEKAKQHSEEIDERLNGFNIDSSCLGIPPSRQAEIQACTDENWDNQMFKLVTNLYYIERSDNLFFEPSSSRTRCVALCNDFLLIPRHLFGSSPNDCYFRISQGGSMSREFAFSDLTVHEIGERWNYNDVCIVRVPKGKVAARSIIDLFCSISELQTFSDGMGELLVIDPKTKYLMRHISNISTEFKTSIKVSEELRITKGFRYTAATKVGDCGSPLIRWDPRSKGKIIGIHIAGSLINSSEGYSCIVDKEWIDLVLGSYGYRQADIDIEDIPMTGGGRDVIPEMQVIGYTPDRVVIPLGPSQFVPSEFSRWGFRIPKTKPCVRTARGESSTLHKVLAKFRKSAPYVDRKLVANISTSLFVKYFMHSPNKKIYTYEEAINCLESVRSVDLSTSPGFPWSRTQMRKSDFVAYDEDKQRFFFVNDVMPNRCKDLEERMLAQQPTSFVFTNCLKDERLPIADVERGKVRLFMICPFDLTILVRKYYGAFVSYLHDIRHQIGVSVGIDPHSDEWHSLAMNLQRNSDELIAIDFSNWDRSIPMEFLGVFFDIADKYYSDEHQMIRDTIRQAILNPVYQLKYLRYRVVSGNPSGCPVTTELNSIANLAMTLYTITLSGFPLEKVLNQTFVATYGDDSVVSTSLPLDIDLFGQQIAALGLLATNTEKSGAISKQSLNRITFLKRSFLWYKGKYYAPLHKDSILESLLWNRRGNNAHYNFEQTINNALTELEQYPPQDVSGDYWRILEFARRGRYQVQVRTHCLASLDHGVAQEGSLNPLENLMIKVSMAVYKMFKMKKIPATREDFDDTISASYVGIDLSHKSFFLSEGIFYHTGFRMFNKTLGRNMELTFSDKGVAWIEPFYAPTFSFPVNMQKTHILNAFNYLPYEKMRNNCIMWGEDLLDASGNRMKVDEKYRNLYARFVTKTKSDNTFLWNGVDNEDNNLFVKSTSYLAQQQGDNITEEIPQPSVRFMTSQEITASSGIRSIDSLLASHTKIMDLRWESKSPYNTTLATLKFPGKLTSVKQYECKLKFTALLRADIEIVLQAADAKLHSGSLIAVWVPCHSEGFPRGMKLTGKQASGMTHTQLILPSQPCVKIIIPFNHFKNFISQTSKDEDEIGALIVKVINPLKPPSSGADVLQIKVLANFINVQAIITTPLTDQSKWVKGENVFPRFAAKESDEQDEKSEKGVISGIATTIANVADIVGGVPILSGVSSTVSVISRTVASAASLMGLSKPRTLQAPIVALPGLMQNVGYADAVDQGKILGLDPKNHVVIQPSLFGSLRDELSIAHLIQIPVLILQKEWKSDSTVGKTLLTIPVHPFVGSSHSVTGYSKPIVQLSYLGYVAAVFKFWRGSITFRIQIIATELHRGALVVAFIPRGTTGVLGLDYEVTIKKIIEIDGVSVTDITVPFVSTAMMNRVGCPFDVIDLESDVATGTIVIKVDRQLLTNSIVPDGVQFNVWVKAEPDFSFSFPSLECMNTFQHTEHMHASQEGDLPDLTPTVGERTDIVMGEDIRNLRQLLKVSSLKYTGQKTFGIGVQEIAFPAHTFTGEDNEAEIFPTFYSYFMRLYRFSRGSIRHKVMFGSMDAKVSAIAAASIREEYKWRATRTLEGAPWCTTHAKICPSLEYEIPFYSKYKMEVHGKTSSERMAIVQVEKFSGHEIKNKIMLYESVGDDFSAGYMMGPPLLFQSLGPMYKLLKSIKLAKAYDGLVDSYYAPELTRAEYTSIEDSKPKKMKAYFQKFYYVDHMPKYTLLVADADIEAYQNITKVPNATGIQLSVVFCLISRDDALFTRSSYSYDASHHPLNAMWVGVYAVDEVTFYSFEELKPGKTLTNIRRLVVPDDLLGNAIYPLNKIRGTTTVDY
nr:MAG: polyprotein [Picornavirales sp.]